MKRLACWLVLCFFIFSPVSEAKPLPPDKVPDLLKPWIDWVLQEYPERACPFLYSDFEAKHCSWTTELSLDLNPTKGSFTSRVQIFKKDDWLVLAGDTKHWPLSVTVNGKTALVMNDDGRPTIKLTAGTYDIKGEFLWDSLPDNLTLPDDTGLINLKMNGQVIQMPTIRESQLWLKESDKGQAKPENVQNHIEVQTYRKITDDVPLQVLTRLDLDVSGAQREEKLSGALLADFIPLQLQSPLPARLEANGQLTVQIRPGHWQIDVLARSSNAVTQLSLPKNSTDSEIWVFYARPELRVVEIESLNSIDASQTNVPNEWRNLPAYKINPDQVMSFKVVRRGDPEPEPNQLNLSRKLWLDFNGTGYTINDRITGRMTSNWRLNTLPETKLGKVTFNDNSQLITKQNGSNKEGVEVRNGLLFLDADSRVVGNVARINAVGWEQSFHQVNAELNLPPGWRLIAATGVDNVPDSWLARWKLLDLFLVLITALATGKLWNRYWGGLALITLILIWHEADAPHFIWLHILAATALLSVLPQNKFFTVISWYRRSCWLVLAAIVLPFILDQVRIGIYPQLEKPWQDIYQDYSSLSRSLPASTPVPAAPMAVGEGQQAEDAVMDEIREEKTGMLANRMNAPAPPALREIMAKPKKAESIPQAEPMQQAQNNNKLDFIRLDPKAKVQTGPGLPQWQWHKVVLSWNGSVDAQQQLHLWYLSPTMTMLLNFLRVFLVTLLALLMVGSALITPSLMRRWGFNLCLLCVLAFATPSENVYAGNFPDQTLLEQLRNKLQEEVVPDCLPSCAHIQQMNMSIDNKAIQINLQVHAQESVVLPLPADYAQWFPNQVLVDNKPAEALYRVNNGLWINLAQGVHEVVLRGVPPVLSKFSLPLPLKPSRVVVDKTSWEVFGLQENGWADDQLQFSRIQANQQSGDKTLPLEQSTLPPFVRVERTLQLGVDWRVLTSITRISPADSAVMLNVPLLKGESVITEGVRVKDHAVEVNMATQQTTLQWESSLEKVDKIELNAPDTAQWIEVWKTDVSPIWHIETSGIAMIHLSNTGQWLPEWHPLPNETINLTITRPESVIGQTLTIDNSHLSVAQGKRMRDVELKASLRSSQGMQHTLTLPENAQLQSVSIDGRSQPLRQEGRKLTLPINPTKQILTLKWQEPVSVGFVTSMSSVDLGQTSVNSIQTLNLGQDRWVLYAFGPTFGPIILFWSVLIVIAIVSLCLGKIPLTPLKHWQWFLLLVGLSQVPMAAASVVVAWLMILGWRSGLNEQTRFFNTLQVSIALLTLISLSILFAAVAEGLSEAPDMQVTGNRSSAFLLNWYQDRSGTTLPAASVVSLPLIAYRVLMLAWSLWLASALLNWLRWGWGCFVSQGLWRKKVQIAK